MSEDQRTFEAEIYCSRCGKQFLHEKDVYAHRVPANWQGTCMNSKQMEATGWYRNPKTNIWQIKSGSR